MPTYCYRSKSGKVLELMLPMSEALEKISHNGVILERDLCTELKRGGPNIMRTSAKPNRLWPKKSVSAGIGAKQVGPDGRYKDPEARARFPHHRFDKSGKAVYNSMKELRRHTKDVGLEAP